MRESKIKIVKRISFYIGILSLLSSTLFLYLGIEDYIRAVINRGTPTLLACSITGIILIAIGIFLLIFSNISNPTVTVKETVLIDRAAFRASHKNKEHDEDAKTCPTCGTANDFDSNFCKKCGLKL